MYWVAGIGLALIQAVSFYFVVKGGGALLRKHWRSGAAVLLGSALLALYVVVLGAVAYLLGPGHVDRMSLEPSHKARILGESISKLMNISAWGAPLGLLTGAVIAVRDWPPDAFSPRAASSGRGEETPGVSRGDALILGCLVGVDLLTKAIAVHVLTGDVELNPGASLQLLLRVNESGLGTWARAVAGGSSVAQRAAGSIAWLALTIYLVATRRTDWALRLKALVGCAIFAAVLAGASLARPLFELIPYSILAAMGRLGPAVFMTYLWSVIRPGLWRTAATLFAAAALGNLLGLLVHPDGVVDFIYSRFITAVFRQGISNVADLYYDAAVVCLVVAGVRTIAVRARQMRAD